MPETSPKDLIVLVPDNDIKFSVIGLLSRLADLGVRQVSYDLRVYERHDAGCFKDSPDLLRLYLRTHSHALVIFDHEGCGKENLSREDVEINVENRISVNGWDDRCSAVVIDPEIEIWVWSDSPQVERILGWQNKQPNLNEWLRNKGFIRQEEMKPRKPKEAFREAIHTSGTPYSSDLFQQLAKSVNFEGCIDPAFRKLKDILRAWFPSA